ncbi:hypothetical protein BKA56DRAFT_364661 [Ilyonectria sp. MPI-CAGE-AT-0026]|nr:hypothetical protein BKA56DRAFT_364661 [Ilyonectria sp. MPI-CAGE-AT-0026]
MEDLGGSPAMKPKRPSPKIHTGGFRRFSITKSYPSSVRCKRRTPTLLKCTLEAPKLLQVSQASRYAPSGRRCNIISSAPDHRSRRVPGAAAVGWGLVSGGEGGRRQPASGRGDREGEEDRLPTCRCSLEPKDCNKLTMHDE